MGRVHFIGGSPFRASGPAPDAHYAALHGRRLLLALYTTSITVIRQ